MAVQGRNYFANHVAAPQILQGTPNYNVEVSEGCNPPGEFYPAHYLPTAISENRIGGSYFVLMPGKVVAMDSNKRLIGAGLASDFAAGNGSGTILYDAEDAGAGFTNANGGLIVSGDKVTTAMYSAGLTVTDPVGIMRYSALMAPGTDPSDPSTYWRHAYDTGGARAFSRWGYIQVPIVETNVRQEDLYTTQEITAGIFNKIDTRIALYPDTSGITLYVGSVAITGVTQKANPRDLVMLTSGNPTQYAITGRTVFFNAPAPSTMNIRYTPKIDLPFTSLVSAGASASPITTANEWGLAKYIGQPVTYDVNSNFKLTTRATTTDNIVGTILDVKVGSSKDLALVRTYFRDFGLWQEAPGSATDGRNAILSIANAPMYIARIAVQFNVPLFHK